jgi:AraC family transcriptional regulator
LSPVQKATVSRQGIREAIVSTGFVYLRPLNVAYIRVTGRYAQSSQEAWARMFAWLHESGMIRETGTGYGLLLDDPRVTPAEKCRYDACVELIDDFGRKLPEDFGIRRLPGGAYARSRHRTGKVGLSKVISSLRDEWAPERGLMPDTRRPVIEIYLDNPELVGDDKCRVDVCLPVVAVADSESAA